jgi:hypothetical protein
MGRRAVHPDGPGFIPEGRHTVGLNQSELVEMVSWVIALPEAAKEALQELTQTEGSHLEDADRIIMNWRADGTWIRAHPNEAIGISSG